MLDKNIFELLNKKLDDATSRKESDQVRRILEKNGEARREFNELKELKSLFQRTPALDPPPSLSVKIRNAISVSSPVRRRIPSRVSEFISSLTAGPRLRYAFSFAGGAVAGIFLFVTFSGIPSDTSSLVGTMGSGNAALRSVQVDAPGIHGQISVQRLGDIIQASIALDGPPGVNVTIEYSALDLQFESLRSPQDDPVSASVQPGTIRFDNASNATYTLVFKARSPEPTGFIATITENGSTVSRLSLDIQQTSH